MSHISYSELKIWNECAYKHKLKYVDRIDAFKGNEFTAFGTAIHEACEKTLLDNKTNANEVFLLKFIEELSSLKENEVSFDKKLITDMREQGKRIFPHVLPALNSYFGKNYKVVSTEEQLYEQIEGLDCKFKGFIDLVLENEGKYHVIDWKTCSWGWDARKKADKMITYQLTLYKHFYAKKHGIDPNNIETHFALLKRTAKKKNVALFRVTSGDKKTKNALNLLNKAVYNIKNKKHFKNRLACTQGYGCEFYRTKNCK